MAKKGGLGLGRGLDALIGGGGVSVFGANKNDSAADTSLIEKATTPKAEEPKTDLEKAPKAFGSAEELPEGVTADEYGTLWVDPARLIPNPKQPRTEFDQDQLEELSDSIRINGVIQPIIIEPTDDGNFYIIAGERRTRASRMAGLKKVPVQIRKYDEVKKLEVALIENIQRADLNPIEEAQAYYNLMQLGDLKHEEVAQRVGKNRSTVTNSVRLLKLPEDMKRALVAGEISAGHARQLLAVTNPADQRILFGKIVGGGLSVHATEELVKELNNGGRAAGKNTAKKVEKKDPDIARIEQKFIDVFGTKVLIKGNLQAGSVEIHYFSADDLDRIYNIIAPSDSL